MKNDNDTEHAHDDPPVIVVRTPRSRTDKIILVFVCALLVLAIYFYLTGYPTG